MSFRRVENIIYHKKMNSEKDLPNNIDNIKN